MLPVANEELNVEFDPSTEEPKVEGEVKAGAVYPLKGENPIKPNENGVCLVEVADGCRTPRWLNVTKSWRRTKC